MVLRRDVNVSPASLLGVGEEEETAGRPDWLLSTLPRPVVLMATEEVKGPPDDELMRLLLVLD